MKQFLSIVFAGLILIACGSGSVDESTLQFRSIDGVDVAFLPNEETPFSGVAVGWHENGQKASEAQYKDGKPVGTHVRWHENGQKKFEGQYKDGKPVGTHVSWHENGQKAVEGVFKDGEQDGVWVHWNENGRRSEEHYKDGEWLRSVSD
jgi:antitoxin component YwqK of YwqJK toxin-antitoxin module